MEVLTLFFRNPVLRNWLSSCLRALETLRECSHGEIIAIKALCRRANVEKVEAGPKGAVLSFRDGSFANPDGLVRYIRDRGPSARVRPDMKVVFFEDWERPDARLKGTARILRSLVNLAEPAKAA